MPRQFDIIGTEKRYYKTNDRLIPKTKESGYALQSDMIQDFVATSSKHTFDIIGKNYFATCIIPEQIPEDLYIIKSWDIRNDKFRLVAPIDKISFYILKTPKIPLLTINISDFIVTLKIIPQSLACINGNIDWGDGQQQVISIPEQEESVEIQHTYNQFGIYNISVNVINGANIVSPVTTISAKIGKKVPLMKHDMIYLMKNSTIIKPIFGNYQLIFSSNGTTGTINTKFDEEIEAGMEIYLYHKFPQLFIIESVNHNNNNTSLIITDYLSNLLNSRICYTGTNQNDGYQYYKGTAGSIIPNIIMDNLSKNRGDSLISAPKSIENNTKLDIKVRYQTVLNVLQNALTQSNIILSSEVTSINPTIITVVLKNGEMKNVNLTKERNCGEIRSKNLLKLANVVLVAGKGEGAKRETAWRGNNESTGIQRTESFVDGITTTETNFLEKQEGNSIDWNFSMKSPYKLYSDFWIGDNIYVDGKLMKITKIDYAVSQAGETCVITLGYGLQSTDKTVLKINDGIVKNYS